MSLEDLTSPPPTKKTLKPEDDEPIVQSRFSPEEEATLVTESNSQKDTGNNLFAGGHYEEAIQGYDKALSSLPNYLDFEVAVLRSNIAACHIKLREWKQAIESATKSLDALERIDPTIKAPSEDAQAGEQDRSKAAESNGSNVVEEIDDSTAEKIEALQRSGHSRTDVQKIRTKALLRRARAREETVGWAELQGAVEDYRTLASMPELAPLDARTVQRALRELPPKLQVAKEQEMGEMMGKLKQLGNGILKPFGLSTDNFKFVKDENTGGYSMNFDQGTGGERS